MCRVCRAARPPGVRCPALVKPPFLLLPSGCIPPCAVRHRHWASSPSNSGNEPTRTWHLGPLLRFSFWQTDAQLTVHSDPFCRSDACTVSSGWGNPSRRPPLSGGNLAARRCIGRWRRGHVYFGCSRGSAAGIKPCSSPRHSLSIVSTSWRQARVVHLGGKGPSYFAICARQITTVPLDLLSYCVFNILLISINHDIPNSLHPSGCCCRSGLPRSRPCCLQQREAQKSRRGSREQHDLQWEVILVQRARRLRHHPWKFNG